MSLGRTALPKPHDLRQWPLRALGVAHNQPNAPLPWRSAPELTAVEICAYVVRDAHEPLDFGKCPRNRRVWPAPEVAQALGSVLRDVHARRRYPHEITSAAAKLIKA